MTLRIRWIAAELGHSNAVLINNFDHEVGLIDEEANMNLVDAVINNLERIRLRHSWFRLPIHST